MSEAVNPLLSEALAKQDAIREKEEQRERVKELLPDFKVLLATTIADHVPPPETKTVEVTFQNLFSDFHETSSRRNRIRAFGTDRKFSTHLEAVIPTEGREVSVTLSSSSYPIKSNGEQNEDLDYKIDVNDFDHILLVKEGKVKIQSKEWESEKITNRTPIGVSLNSWPVFERDAKPDELEGYSSLINSFNQEGVTFTGSTPTLVIRDYSKIQQETAARNAHLVDTQEK